MSEKTRDKGVEDPMWLVEPPVGNEILVSIGLGKDAKMTPAVRASIDAVVSSLMTGDVTQATLSTGYDCGGAFNRCGTFSCSLQNCQPLKRAPSCLALISCTIQNEN